MIGRSLQPVHRCATVSGGDTVRGVRGLTFEAHQGLAGLERLTPEWERLVQTLPEIHFNHLPGWYRAYLACGDCDPQSVWFVSGYRDTQLVAICPLKYQTHRVRLLRPRYLGTLEGEELQLSDFVFAPTAESASLIEELTRWLRSQHTLQWDVLRLVKISEQSSLGHAARAGLPRLSIAAEYEGSAYFDTRGTYEQATRAMNGKMRSNLRRRYRLANSAAGLRFESCRQPHEVARAFEIFLDIESSGWKGPAGNRSSIRCVPSVLAFYSGLLREFGSGRIFVINLLWHGEQAIAGQLGLHLGRTLYILKVGYRDDHPTLAPGILLQDQTLRHACEHPHIDVLHMVNHPQWVHGFKPLSVRVSLYCVPNMNAHGLLAQLGHWLKRAWFARPAGTPERA